APRRKIAGVLSDALVGVGAGGHEATSAGRVAGVREAEGLAGAGLARAGALAVGGLARRRSEDALDAGAAGVGRRAGLASTRTGGVAAEAVDAVVGRALAVAGAGGAHRQLRTVRAAAGGAVSVAGVAVRDAAVGRGRDLHVGVAVGAAVLAHGLAAAVAAAAAHRPRQNRDR